MLRRLCTQRVKNLIVLELNNRVRGVTFAMVFGEHLKSLVVATLADEPSGRLRDKPDKEELDNGWKALQS